MYDGIEDLLLNCYDFTHIRYTLISNVPQNINVDFRSFKSKAIFKALTKSTKKQRKFGVIFLAERL